jgi:hypothetical protein
MEQRERIYLMYLCNEGHEEIVHDNYKDCPLCKALDELSKAQDEISELNDEIKSWEKGEQ